MFFFFFLSLLDSAWRSYHRTVDAYYCVFGVHYSYVCITLSDVWLCKLTGVPCVIYHHNLHGETHKLVWAIYITLGWHVNVIAKLSRKLYAKQSIALCDIHYGQRGTRKRNNSQIKGTSCQIQQNSEPFCVHRQIQQSVVLIPTAAVDLL